jgi:prepilin-type N-terminal cleavage/methylation domain-containing protein
MGLTLIELLVVIAVISVLFVLTMGAVRGVRSEQRVTRWLSLLRVHTAVFTQYSMDSKGYLPWYTSPTGPVIVRSGDDWWTLKYFEAVRHWNLLLAEPYYGVSCRDMAFVVKGKKGFTWTDFVYSSSFLAEPAYWRETTRIGPVQWKGTRLDSVRQPWLKSLIHNDYPPWNNGEYIYRKSTDVWQVGLADASARRVPTNKLAAPYQFGDGRFEGSTSPVGRPLMDTIDGILGTDIQP